MINLNNIVNNNNEKHNEKWPYIPDHPYRILIIGGYRSGKTNTMNDVYENIDNYNSKRKRKILIVFDDMIPDIMTNKKFQSIIKELFIRCRKLNVSLVFITQSYSSVPKDVRLNSTHYLIMRINSKKELQNIAINHSADIDFKDFIQIYRECTKEPNNFLTIDTTLPASNPLRFRKNLFDTL